MAWYPITVNQEPVESVFEFKTTCLEPLSDFLFPPTLYHRAPLLSRLSGVDTTEGVGERRSGISHQGDGSWA